MRGVTFMRAAPAALAALSALVATVIAGPAQAAEELTIDVTLSDREVLVGDVVSLQVRTVSLINGNISVVVPRVPGLAELSRSSSEGTSVSWDSRSGQKVTREQTLGLELQANKAGTLTIPAFVAKVAGRSAQSRPLTLKVIASAALAADAPQAEAGQVAPPDPGEDKLFARYRLNKGSAYLGEQVLLDLEIFATPNRNFSLEEMPDAPELDGFWKTVVFKPTKLTRRVEVVAGRRYHVYRLWRMALFGLSAGDRTLPPARLSFSTNRGMFGSGRRIRVRTKPVKLSILPLPTEGRPAGFSSTNVGQYKLRATVDARTVPAGKAVLLKVALSGVGNIENARLPELKDIDGFRVFPPTVKTENQTSLNGIQGTKSAEILLMPTRGGRLQVPALSLPIYDPGRKGYQRLSTPSISIVVNGEPVAAPAVQAAPTRPKPADAKLQPLHVRADVSKWSPPPFGTRAFFIALALPPLLFVLLLLGEWVWARTQRQTSAHLRRAVARDAQSRLQQAKSEADAGHMDRAYAAFVDALFTLGSERMQVALQGMTTEEVCAQLQAHGATPQTVQRVQKELQTADYARFAAGAVAGLNASAVLADWGDILSAIEALEPKERTL